MLKIVSFEKEGRANKIWMDDGSGSPRVQIMLDGILEAYMGTYALAAGQALMLVIADGNIEGIDCPEITEPNWKSKVSEAIKAAEKIVDWSAVDRNQMLSEITLTDDLADEMVNSWAEAVAIALEEEPVSHGDASRMMTERSLAYAEGMQLRQEEILADEYMQVMDESDLRAPRTVKPVERIGFSIEIVP